MKIETVDNLFCESCKHFKKWTEYGMDFRDCMFGGFNYEDNLLDIMVMRFMENDQFEKINECNHHVAKSENKGKSE